MPKQVPQAELDAVLQAVARFSEGASIEDIRGALDANLPRRTLQRRLALLVRQKRLTVEGRGRGSRYNAPPIGKELEGGRNPFDVETLQDLLRPVDNQGTIHEEEGSNEKSLRLGEIMEGRVLQCEGAP